jgi:hypothetical protein
MVMEVEDLCARLTRGEIVAISTPDWQALAGRFAPLEEHDTLVSGAISVQRGPCGVVVVEEPKPAERVLRPLADVERARLFVAERLATYDRMWNGCGCKIDYYR